MKFTTFTSRALAGAVLMLAAGMAQSMDHAAHGAAEPAKAAPMQAYMKSAMPFRGIPKPARTAALRPVFRSHVLEDRESWEATVRLLWDGAAFREERYAATDLARHRPYSAWPTDRRPIPLAHASSSSSSIRSAGSSNRARRAGLAT